MATIVHASKPTHTVSPQLRIPYMIRDQRSETVETTAPSYLLSVSTRGSLVTDCNIATPDWTIDMPECQLTILAFASWSIVYHLSYCLSLNNGDRCVWPLATDIA